MDTTNGTQLTAAGKPAAAEEADKRPAPPEGWVAEGAEVAREDPYE